MPVVTTHTTPSAPPESHGGRPGSRPRGLTSRKLSPAREPLLSWGHSPRPRARVWRPRQRLTQERTRKAREARAEASLPPQLLIETLGRFLEAALKRLERYKFHEAHLYDGSRHANPAADPLFALGWPCIANDRLLGTHTSSDHLGSVPGCPCFVSPTISSTSGF